MKKIQPINQLCIKDSEGKTPGGIIIPETAKEKPKGGEVVAISAGASEQISVGDRVIYKDFSGTQINFEGEDYLLVPAGDILTKYVEVDSI
ncbi:MAG: co-chaperone GroES [Candidatus Omnitrophica bacterium]|nr:co-chaperone GroES [Candidatus Omnitrophota bacterium]